MSDNDEILKRQVEQSFAKVLNRNGYGFQFSVIKKAHELGVAAKSAWKLETIELPVEVRGSGTRIDFVLRKRAHHSKPFFLLAECKRANPSLSNWCFVRAPYTNRNQWGNSEPIFMEYIQMNEDGSMSAYAKKRSSVENFYHIGLEVRSNLKGDPTGESGRAIEDAASQVIKGLNGYIEMISKNHQMLRGDRCADFMPVIFTTAQLWGSEANLSRANIETGDSDLSGVGFNRLPWLFYQYHLSPGIKHSHSPVERPPEISDLMDTEYVRTIPIVSPSGVESFLTWSSYALDLYD